MANYYKYSFVSPSGIYAIVKEELKSYMDTGAVDDLLFPTYVNKCLRKLENASYPLVEELLFVEDFEAILPDSFHAVREAWMCGDIQRSVYSSANSQYLQNISILPQLDIHAVSCESLACDLQGTVTFTPVIPDLSYCDYSYEDPCDYKADPSQMEIVKINSTRISSVRKMYMLKPGNISARANCDVDYASTLSQYGQNILDRDFTPYSSAYNSFDIRDKKFVTNFRKGVVHLLFYSIDYDSCGDQLVPDNFRILEYIEAFLKYKIFETLTNQVNDETFNQLQQKLVFYKQQSDEAFVMASIELKKQTIHKKQQSINALKNRFNQYRTR